MKLNLLIPAALSCAILFNCTRAKEAANDGGEFVGETVTEFVDGVTSGVETATAVSIDMSDELKQHGLELGVVQFDASEWEASDNVLEVYVIFNQAFNDTVNVKVMDENGLEIGRANAAMEAEAGDAGYYDFVFDERTNIDTDDKVVMSL